MDTTKQSCFIDARLKLEFAEESSNTSRLVENCGKNAHSVSMSADRSGIFICPLKGEVEIQDMICKHHCGERRRV